MFLNLKFVKPTVADISIMQNIIAPHVEEGIILYRSENEIANTIRSYTLAVLDEEVVGFAALHIYSTKLAEVRMLAVKKEFQKKGIGYKLVEKLLEEGKKLGLKRVLTLTYSESLFTKLGFKVIEKQEIPDHKVWEDCIKCKRFPICKEIALVIDL